MNEQMNNLPERIGKAVEDAIETAMNRALFEFESRMANAASGAKNAPSVDNGMTEYAKREFPSDILSGLTRQVSQIQQDSENTRLLAEIAVDVRSILEAIATQGGG